MSVNDYHRIPLSWKPDKRLLKSPQYLSLASLLECDIVSGKLAAGTQLPPQRLLADYLDLNFTTVTRAYDLCREKRLIYGEVGRGTYVLPVSQREEGMSDVVELGVVLGFPYVTQAIVETAREVVSRSYCHELFSYTAREGLLHQREAGTQWMARRGVHTDVSRTAIFAGAQNAITTLLLTLFHVGDCIATDVFTYSNLIGIARLAHIRLIAVPGGTEGMSAEALESLCCKQHISGIFLMPDHANPTTITMCEARRDALSVVCEKYSLIIIEDDASLFIGNHRTFYSRLPEQTIYIAATTRHIASGLRVTFATFPEQWRSAVMGGLFVTSIKASPLDAEILSQLIVSGKAEKILEEKAQLSLEANKIYDKIFPHDPIYDDRRTFFRMHPINSRIQGRQWEEYALSNGIRVCHSYRFLVDKKSDQSFLRLSVSSTRSMEALEHGLLVLREIEERVKL